MKRLENPIGLVTRCRRHDIGDKLGWMKSSIELALAREEFSEELRAFLRALLADDIVRAKSGSAWFGTIGKK
jgi:UTP--glucose-1-phosphate uridylyltransferase